MQTKKIMPTTWLLVSIIVIVALHYLFPIAIIIAPIWNLLGIIPLALGVLINLSADRAFHQANTTVKPYEESAALVTDGVFRFSRNPMYLGFLLVLVGIALLLRSLSPYGVILIFGTLMDRMYIQVEEQMLADNFGERWQSYKRSTRRWL